METKYFKRKLYELENGGGCNRYIKIDMESPVDENHIEIPETLYCIQIDIFKGQYTFDYKIGSEYINRRDLSIFEEINEEEFNRMSLYILRNITNLL